MLYLKIKCILFLCYTQAFNNLMDNTLDDLGESFVCSTIADVEQLQQEHEGFKTGGLQDAKTKYEELSALTEAMAEMGSTDNTYTTLTPTVLLVLCTNWNCVCS